MSTKKDTNAGRSVCCCETCLHKLEIRDTEKNACCPVCLSTDMTKEIKFPAEGCSHYFCVECSQCILQRHPEEAKFQLNPCVLGCPPCPKGCTNPPMGKQCECVEKTRVVEEWKAANHLSWVTWKKLGLYLMTQSVQDMRSQGDSRGSGTCPVCRRQSRWRLKETDSEEADNNDEVQVQQTPQQRYLADITMAPIASVFSTHFAYALATVFMEDTGPQPEVLGESDDDGPEDDDDGPEDGDRRDLAFFIGLDR